MDGPRLRLDDQKRLGQALGRQKTINTYDAGGLVVYCAGAE